MDMPQVIAVWVHTLAFVIVLGYYGVLGRVTLPALERSLDGPALATALVAIERRALPLLVLSAGLFIVTGSILLIVDPKYAGLGDFFASTWTTLMLVKHVVVVGVIVLGVLVDQSIRQVGEATGDASRTAAVRRLRLSAEGATGLGALVILLTAAAEIAD
jgi:uncharacterized membrane protein